jgi:RimJ/RimL family protein N-acetyltransferase
MQEALKEQTLAAVQRLKEQPAAGGELPVFQYGQQIASLVPVTRADLDRAAALALLTEWQLPAPAEGARQWLAQHILDVPDRLLFWVNGLDGKPVGCVGLADFDFAGSRVQIRPLVRGVPAVLSGVMYAGVQALLAWTFHHSPVQTVCLEIAVDNRRALRLAELSGFRPTSPAPTPPAPDRGTVTLSLARAEWVSGHRPERAAYQAGPEKGAAASAVCQNAAA